MRLQVFEVMAVVHPEDEEDKKDTVVVDGGIVTILAKDEKTAAMKFIQSAPGLKLDTTEVLVRPF